MDVARFIVRSGGERSRSTVQSVTSLRFNFKKEAKMKLSVRLAWVLIRQRNDGATGTRWERGITSVGGQRAAGPGSAPVDIQSRQPGGNNEEEQSSVHLEGNQTKGVGGGGVSPGGGREEG